MLILYRNVRFVLFTKTSFARINSFPAESQTLPTTRATLSPIPKRFHKKCQHHKDKSIKLYLFSYFSSFSHLDSTCTPHVWHLRTNNHVLLFNMLRIFYFYLSDRNIRLSLCLIRNHYRVKFSFGKDKSGKGN